MRVLDTSPTQYILSAELIRLSPKSKLKPTVYVLVSKTGAEVQLWQEKAEAEIAGMRTLASTEQLAAKRVELDTDFIASGVLRIVDAEDPASPADNPTYVTITEPKAVRAHMAALELRERNEFTRVLRSREDLLLGEAVSLQSRVTSFYGEQENLAATSTTTASDAPLTDGSEIVDASSTQRAAA